MLGLFSSVRGLGLVVSLFLAANSSAQDFGHALLREVLEDKNEDFVPDRVKSQFVVEGVVNSDPNVISANACFSSMQDRTAGIFLFSSNPSALEEKVTVGDRVRVSGTLEQYRGMEVLALASIEKLGRGVVTPREVLAADLLTERFNGQLVRLRGDLIMPSQLAEFAEGLQLKDRSGSVPIFLTYKSFTDTRFVGQLLKGGAVEITGIAGQSQKDPPFNQGYCMFPRKPQDFDALPESPHRWIIGALSSLCLLGLIAYLWDRRKVLTALRASEGKYRGLFESSKDGIAVFNLNGCCLEANPAFLDMLGYTHSEITKLTHAQLWSSASRHLENKIFGSETFKRGYSNEFETEYQRKDGSKLPTSIRAWLIKDKRGQHTGVWVIIRDVTEQKRSREALLASEQRFHNLAEISPVGIFNTDSTGRCVYVNQRWLEISGLTADQAYGEGWITAIHIDDRNRIGSLWKHSMSRNEPFKAEYRLQTSHGVTTWVLGEAVVERTAEGKCKGYIGTLTDITDRYEAEQALRESEERFRQMAENVHEVFWLASLQDDSLIYLSPVFEKIWGRSCQEAQSSPELWANSIHPEDKARVSKAMEMRRYSGNYDEIYRIVRQDGSTRWIHDRAVLIRDHTGQPYRIAGVAEDISKQRKLEEDLRHSQKMESIGRLAGGVAHDFNNILTVIQGHASLLLIGNNLSEKARDSIEQVLSAADRAANLTRQLLAFSRKQVMQMRTINLSDLVSNMTKMFRRVLGEDISLHVDFCASPALVHADPGMLEQVVMNLVVNARDAMPRGGRLSISTSVELSAQSKDSALRGMNSGPFVVLSVADTGCGISPEDLPYIFDPFFTTKEVGKGTGLGLATAYGVVKQHQGWIDVDSTENFGTTFSVFLPAFIGETADNSKSQDLPEIRSGIETVLVVEDEPSLRSLVRAVLEQHGYKVLEASDGISGLEMWEKEKEQVDIVLLDVVMPNGMTGLDVAELLYKDRPDIKVLFTSGYSTETVNQVFLATSDVRFLQKPYHPRKLLQMIRQYLDEGA